MDIRGSSKAFVVRGGRRATDFPGQAVEESATDQSLAVQVRGKWALQGARDAGGLGRSVRLSHRDGDPLGPVCAGSICLALFYSGVDGDTKEPR